MKRSLRVFVDFLQQNGLVTEQILAPNADVNSELKICRYHLTEEGFAIFCTAYQKWLKGLDRGKSVDDVSSMEKALKKLRESSS